MELKPAKRKKCSAPTNWLLFPTGVSKPFVAYFTGASAFVKDKEHMEDLFSMGVYGKGTLSRSEPIFNTSHDDLPNVLMEQQWENRKNSCYTRNIEPDDTVPVKYNRQLQLGMSSIAEFITTVKETPTSSWKDYKSKISTEGPSIIKIKCSVPSWSECLQIEGDYVDNKLLLMVNNILLHGKPREVGQNSLDSRNVLVVGGKDGPRLENETKVPGEVLQLDLQETFFLAGALGKLNVYNQSGKLMTIQEMWTTFRAAENKFIERYAVYHWYRSRGWVVRSGLIYGGDFLLYEKGPLFCHSSYLVRVTDNNTRLAWNDLALLRRLVETFKKDIILCCVSLPDYLTDEDMQCPTVVSRLRVREMMFRRWVPSQERSAK